MGVTVLIPAAGSGRRMLGDEPKAFLALKEKPLIVWSLAAFASTKAVERAIIAAPPGFEEVTGRLAEIHGVELAVEVVTGGASRAESVRAAFRAAADASEVLIHDAARPLVTAELVEDSVEALHEWGCAAVVCAVPVTDTIKKTDGSDRIGATVPRQRLWSAQTPQLFRADDLRAAYEQIDREYLAKVTDEAQLIEDVGGDVRIFRSSPDNIKVTTPIDLALAELLLEARELGG